GNAKLNAHPPIAVIVHVDHLALAGTQLLHDDANKLLGNIDRETLNRLHELAIGGSFGDDFRLTDHQLIALAAHHLEQNGELQFAASHDFERVRASPIFNPKRHIRQKFFLQTVTEIARGHELYFFAGEG